MAKKPPAEIPASPAKVKLKALSIQDCYQLALKRSETLAIKNVDIEKTWADFLKATSIALGTVDFEITDFFQQKQKNPPPSGTGSSNTTNPEIRQRQFSITQPLFQGFKALGAIRGAGSLRKQMIAERDRAEQLLFMDVADSFYSLIRYDKEIRITEEILKLYQERIEELVEREKIGRSRSSEVISVKARMEAKQGELIAAKGKRLIAQRFLEFLTGIPLDNRLFVDTLKVREEPDSLATYLEGTATRPDVIAAEENQKTNEQGIVIAQSDLWPTFNLNSNYYEHREGASAGIDWDVLFTFDIPLFRGGGTLGSIKEAWSNFKQSKLNVSRTKRLAELEVQQAYDQWISSLNQHKVYQLAAESANESYELERTDYVHSLVSNLDVLQALEVLNNAMLDENRTYYALKHDYWALQVATGTCCKMYSGIET